MGKIRILYAEDYELVLFAAKKLLEAEGWEVEVCRDDETALRHLEADEGFDLFILDDRFAGAGGGELIERAGGGARLRGSPVILFTTRQPEEVSASLAAARLSKPAGLKDLVETCRRLLPRAAAAPPDAKASGSESVAD